jgi:hypothetical protein
VPAPDGGPPSWTAWEEGSAAGGTGADRGPPQAAANNTVPVTTSFRNDIMPFSSGW